ncbi:MAG: hypothetical protein AABZ33_11280 [Chloroflexota bacterium]
MPAWEFAPAGPIIAGLLVVLLSATGSYAALVVTGPGPAATPVGSPAPTSATETASPSATVSVPPEETPVMTPSAWRSADIDRLMLAVPKALAGSCTILSPAISDPLRSADAIAAVNCHAAGSPQEVTYELLPDTPATQSGYRARVASSSVVPGSSGCWNGRPGEVDYSYGRALCWIDAAAGLTRVVWMDERVRVLASAAATPGDLQALVDWWWNAAMLQPNPTSAGLTPDEQFVMDQVPGWLRPSCKAYDAAADAAAHAGVADPVGDLGAIDCLPNDTLIEDVGWFRFTTPAALQAWYGRRIAQVGVSASSGGCLDGTPGETAWSAGRIACYRRASNNRAAIRWINERAGLYGALNATNPDLPALVTWWQDGGLP